MKATRIVLCGLLVATLVACEEPPVMTDGGGDASAAAASATATASAKATEPPPVVFTESDFIESEESRDPYREYTSLFVKAVDEVSRDIGRKVKAPMYALDEMKLVGIVGGSPDRAMLVDPKAYGWILYPGDFIGKAELVNTGGTEAQEVPLNWKVDRIRENDVVFVREDPARPQIARTTRVLPLHTGDGHSGR